MPATPGDPLNDGRLSRRTAIKIFSVCTIVVAFVGMGISLVCAIIVAVGWKSLRAGTGDESTVGTIFASTQVSHAAYWLTVVLSVLLYVAALWLTLRKPRERVRRAKRKRAWKA